MTFDSSESTSPSVYVMRAEQALMTLKQSVANHADQESRLKRFYREWQENWLLQSEQLQKQMEELEARLSPWIPRGDALRLAVVSQTEEAA